MNILSNYLFECEGLTKKFGSKTALEDVSFRLSGGRIVGLLGPNGSGKTTLIKLANGLLTPSSGSIFIGGDAPGVQTKRMVSYLPDLMSLPEGMKVSEVIRYYEDFFEDFDRAKAEDMMKSLKLNQSERIKSLSKGTKEKVQLCLTMSRNTSVYLLDEPMGGVDPATRDYILNTIIANYSENALVVISTHLIADVEKILDDVMFINEGKIVYCDSVERIRENKGQSVDELFREVFKC